MKFRVDRAAFADAVSWTAKSLPQRPAVAVLAGVRMKAADGMVTLSSFDYETSAMTQIEADIETPGDVLVSGRLLAGIAKSLPHKPVDVELEGPKLAISCGSANFALMSMPTDSYPELPAMPKTTGHVDAATLAEAVKQVAVASANDDTLPLLTTVNVAIHGATIEFMATDRYRLSVRRFSWDPVNADVSLSALVKAKTLSDMSQSLAGAGQVAISLANNDGEAKIVGMEVAGRRMTSQLVDGDYPPVARLFPEETPIYAVMSLAELHDALRRVSLVAERQAPVRMSFSAGGLQLDAGQGEDAQASEHVNCHFHGDDIETAFNPHYLMDGLGALNTEYVRISFTHPSKPAVITGQEEVGGDEDPALRYLLMPIRYE